MTVCILHQGILFAICCMLLAQSVDSENSGPVPWGPAIFVRVRVRSSSPNPLNRAQPQRAQIPDSRKSQVYGCALIMRLFSLWNFLQA